MKKKVLVSSAILGLLFTYLVSAKTVNAFWLFDLFRGGQVKGEQTTGTSNSIPAYVQEMMRRFRGGDDNNQGRRGGSETNATTSGQTGGGRSAGEQENQGVIPEAKINQLVASGKLTRAQADELLSKMRAIKSKKDELMALEKDLKAWFKNNKIDTKAFGTGGQQGNQGGGGEQNFDR